MLEDIVYHGEDNYGITLDYNYYVMTQNIIDDLWLM